MDGPNQTFTDFILKNPNSPPLLAYIWQRKNHLRTSILELCKETFTGSKEYIYYLNIIN